MSETNKTMNEEEALSEALSPIVNKLIDKNYETSKDKIASQMAPLIGSAIREQIKSQKDDVVDALYPVMGNMISKYVTQSLEDLLNKINTQIQNGLSVETLKRKIKAKIKGVSETELLLSENIDSPIQAALLIHKETGLVLAHAESKNQKLNEPEMLASMMTAIRSFINDWVEKNSQNQELGEIDYGGNKIIIEASGYSYLAVIVSGATNKTTYDKIRSTLGNIVLKYGEGIKNFNGDLNSFAQEETKEELLKLLLSEQNSTIETKGQEKKNIHPLIYIIPLIFIIWGSYAYYKSYEKEKLLTQIDAALYKTPQLTSYKFKTTLDDGIVTIKGSVPFSFHKQLASKIIQKIQGVKKVDNKIVILPTLNDPMQISSNIAYLLKGLNTQEGVNISYTYDYDTLNLKGKVWDKTRRDKILQEIAKIKGIKKITNNIAIIPPTVKTTIYFQKNSIKPSKEEQKKLISLIKKLNKLDTNYTLKAIAYSDMIGSKKKNARLAKERLASIKNFLINQGEIKNHLLLERKITPPDGVDYMKYPQKARCIVLSLKREQ